MSRAKNNVFVSDTKLKMPVGYGKNSDLRFRRYCFGYSRNATSRLEIENVSAFKLNYS